MSETMTSLDDLRDTPVNQVIRSFPETVAVFNRHGIEACCGGSAPVVEAARRDGADPEQLEADLRAAIRGEP
jgi:iron-sulfur cluster repair protein YtfE (RIC family)